MAIIFKTSSLRKEFEELCQKIIPELNDCNNCGILKCVFCSKFTVSCSICRKDRCKNCVLFQNTVIYYSKNVVKNNGIMFATFYMIFLEFLG